jgi:predicted enzyme related to lactoylglutathione lyase
MTIIVFNNLMLNLNSIMLGAAEPKTLAAFYEIVFEKPADMTEGEWFGWQAGSAFFSLGKHSEASAKAQEPFRVIFNFETKEVESEFARLKQAGATVIKEPYDMGGMMIATLADPEGNYFQLMSPWKQ